VKPIIFIDGASRGNPGPAAIGVQITSNGKILVQVAEKIGLTTNNQAEYLALIRALIETKKLGARNAAIFSDSELLVRQIKGVYKVKDENLKLLFRTALWMISAFFEKIELTHIPREKNVSADALANQALNS
jgi:ribonuclease HI